MNKSSGVSLATVVTVVFVILKLTHTIDWSWWLVFSPTLISIGLSLILILIAFIIMLIINTSPGVSKTTYKARKAGDPLTYISASNSKHRTLSEKIFRTRK